tara:strand:- start:2467 stop:3051 length:585 start_codon:yes stop_codon:yes gene_type:complete
MNRGFTYYIRDKTNPDLVYYGSSEMPTVDDRIKAHINKFIAWKKNSNLDYYSSYKILEKDNYEYDTIDVVYFDTKHELRQYERVLIEGQICVNEVIPNRTYKEYYQTNKEWIAKKNAEIYKQNKEKIQKRHKEYDIKNKEKVRERKRKYREANIDKINKKFECPCGGKYTHSNKSIHIKSQKHLKWVQSQITET